MFSKLLFTVFVLSTVHGQQVDVDGYLNEKEKIYSDSVTKLSHEILALDEEVKDIERKIAVKLKAESELRDQVQVLQDKIKLYSGHVSEFLAKRERLQQNTYYKYLSTERSFARCLGYDSESSLAINAFILCHENYPKKSQEASELTEFVFAQLIPSPFEMQNTLKQRSYSLSVQMQQQLNLSSQLDIIQAKRETKNTVLSNGQEELAAFRKKATIAKPYLSCSMNSTIDLEEEAPLSKAPRDDQMILSRGTCYAHFAKDVISSLYEGEFSPSYIDLETLYSKKVKNNPNGDDGGSPCVALNLVKNLGMCDYKKSLLERLVSVNGGGIYNPHPSHAQFISLVREIDDYIYEKNQLSVAFNAKSKVILENELEWIERIKDLPPVDLLAVNIMVSFLPDWKVEELYIYNLTNAQKKDMTLDKWKRKIAAERISMDAKILSTFQHELVNDCVSQKCTLLKDNIVSFIRQEFEEVLGIKNLVLINDSIDNFIFNEERPQAMKERYAQINKLAQKEITEANDFKNVLVELKIVSYWKRIEKLGLQGLGIGGRLALDLFNLPAGQSNSDRLRQIFVPECEKSENRVELSKSFSCSQVAFGSDKNKYDLRFEVLAHLLSPKPIPVGRILYVGNELHINSIVGMRKSPANENCEFKIRESNGAVSNWTAESVVLKSLNAMVLVESNN
jgi:hypothetical protein